MWFLLAFLVAAFLVWNKKDMWWDTKTDNIKAGEFLGFTYKYAGIMFTIALFVTIFTGSIVVIPAGHRGVIFDKVKGVQTIALKEGLNFVMPIVQSVELFEVRTRKIHADATASSKDLQTVHTSVSLNLNADPEQVGVLYKNVGADYDHRVIEPVIQECVKAVTALYTAEELITRREDVKTHIQDLISKQLLKINVILSSTYITNFEFGKQFNEAIELKQVAEQQALKAKRDLERVKIEADQKVASARAEAESLRMQKDNITPQMLQLRSIEVQAKAIEKWNGKLPDQMIPGGSLPFLNLDKLNTK